MQTGERQVNLYKLKYQTLEDYWHLELCQLVWENPGKWDHSLKTGLEIHSGWESFINLT